MKKLLTILTVSVMATPAFAEPAHNHNNHDHKMHENMVEQDEQNLSEGTGVLHDINVEEKKVNITHAPIPSLRWPEMTMDLPVSDNVDLSNFSADDEVKFFLKLEDKTYIIEKMEVMKIDAENDHKHEMKKEDHSQHHHEDDHSNHH